MELVKELGDCLRDTTSQETIIRSGDYPREKGLLDVTVVLSELKDVQKVREYYGKSTELIGEIKKRREDIDDRLQGIEKAAKDIPSLL